jgi:hypothetical protein
MGSDRMGEPERPNAIDNAVTAFGLAPHDEVKRSTISSKVISVGRGVGIL